MPERPPTWWLQWRERGELRRIRLDRPVRIGRARSNDIVLEDPAVSRQHCVVNPMQANVLIDASASSGGVRVDGQRVTMAAVADGFFDIGSIRFALGRDDARSGSPLLPIGVAAFGGALVVTLVVFFAALAPGSSPPRDALAHAVESRSAAEVAEALGEGSGGEVEIAGILAALPPGTSLRQVSRRVERDEGDFAIVVATYEVTNAAGSTVGRVSYRIAYERRDGRWVVQSTTPSLERSSP